MEQGTDKPVGEGHKEAALVAAKDFYEILKAPPPTEGIERLALATTEAVIFTMRRAILSQNAQEAAALAFRENGDISEALGAAFDVAVADG